MKGVLSGPLCTGLAAMAFVLLGPVSAASAEVGQPTISSPTTGSFVNSSTPSFSGDTSDLSDEVVLQIFAGEGTSGSPLQTVGLVFPSPSGEWSAAPALPLSDGVYTAQAVQVNAAAEMGLPSPPVTFTVDTTAPQPSIARPEAGSYLRTSTPIFSGATGNEAGDAPTVAVNVYAGPEAVGQPAQTLTATRNGASWKVEDTAGLPDGTYTAQAEQSDDAGNVGHSEAVSFTIDTTPPRLSIAEPEQGAYLATAEPTFSGSTGNESGDDATVTVRIYEAPHHVKQTLKQTLLATRAGGTWSVQASAALADGTYTAEAKQSDEAGNVGSSEPVTFTVDAEPPKVTISSPTNGATIRNPRPRFSGTAGAKEVDDLAVIVNVYSAGPKGEALGTPLQTLETNRAGSGWSAQSSTTGLRIGTYVAQATQRDKAGGEGTSQPVEFSVEGPGVSLEALPQFISASTPSFRGEASNENTDPEVKLKIYSGTDAGAGLDPPVEEAGAEEIDGHWSTGPVGALPDGTYTAQAEQSDRAGNIGVSNESTFTIDTTPPKVTLTSPQSGASFSTSSQEVAGAAGTEPGDGSLITVKLFAGSAPEGQLAQEIRVPASNGGWSATFAGLSPGTYTARAEQSDEVGNVGLSQPATFTLVSPAQSSPPQPSVGSSDPAPPAPPVASFQWFPAAPEVGETVLLVSNSSDPATPLSGFEWSPSGGESFQTGASTFTTSFATPGAHAVRLRVINAAGLASVATETVAVSAPVALLMQPFPVVRIAGRDTRTGVKLSILTVQAPVGATVTIACRGRGCPFKAKSRVAKASAAGMVKLTFGQLERALPAGVTLEIRISKAGQIGKYTRFVVRRHKLPERVDSCLGDNGVAPTACPS